MTSDLALPRWLPPKVTPDFIERHKEEIDKARSFPRSLKKGSPRRVLVELARVQCGYKETANPEQIWSAIIQCYHKIYFAVK